MNRDEIEKAITEIDDRYIAEAAEADAAIQGAGTISAAAPQAAPSASEAPVSEAAAPQAAPSVSEAPAPQAARTHSRPRSRHGFFYRHYVATVAACMALLLIGSYVIQNSFMAASGAVKVSETAGGTVSYGSESNGLKLYSKSESISEDSLSADEAGEAQKIIYTATVTAQTEGYDDAVSGIEAAVDTRDGFIQQKNTSSYNGDYRTVSYIIRVPEENFRSLLGDIDGLCLVTSSNEGAEDISETYYDIQSRLETAQIKLARLQELLSQAENMEDIITIESSISDTEYQIESLQSQLDSYDSQVSYATVRLTLNEVYQTKVVETPRTFWDKLGAAFSDGIENFGDFCEDFALWLAESWITLIILAGIGTVIVLIIKKRRRSRTAD